MPDRDPAQRAKKTIIPLIQKWPPNTQDFNPIKTLLSNLKGRIFWKEKMTKEEIFYKVKKACKKIHQMMINILIIKFNKRVLVLKKHNYKLISELIKNKRKINFNFRFFIF